MKLVIYYREGCHLCEQLAAQLQRGWPHLIADFEWRDVDTRHEWFEAYDTRVPIVTVDDEVLFEYFIDEKRLAEHLGEPHFPL